MKKKLILLLVLYELGRLAFLLSMQINLEGVHISFGWYMLSPLLGLPFVLLYVVYTAIKNEQITEGFAYAKELGLLLFVMQKLATVTGFVLFLFQYMKNLSTNIMADGVYFIKMVPFVMIFFAIDVILSVVIIIKQSNKEKRSES